MKEGRIIALVGPSGAGKSTTARETQEAYEQLGCDVIIVGRDKIREMCYGYSEAEVWTHYTHEDFNIREYKVSEIQDTIIRQALRENKVVIVDNTHLRAKYIKDLTKYGVDVYCQLVEAPIEECIKRDVSRPRSVGESIIKKQFEQLNSLKKNFDLDKVYKPEHSEKIVNNINNKPCIIFDIDGTLALMGDRSPYDMTRVGEDLLNLPVFVALENARKADYKIVICTGREGTEEAKENTLAWLKKFHIEYDEFHMRPKGNYEKDWKVKEEMWRDITQRYYIFNMYDDRNQVVDHARKLGFSVFQVAEGNF